MYVWLKKEKKNSFSLKKKVWIWRVMVELEKDDLMFELRKWWINSTNLKGNQVCHNKENNKWWNEEK